MKQEYGQLRYPELKNNYGDRLAPKIQERTS